jgi:hypothetical protein
MKKMIFGALALMSILSVNSAHAYTEHGKGTVLGNKLYCTYLGTCFTDNNPFNPNFIPGNSYYVESLGGWYRLYSSGESNIYIVESEEGDFTSISTETNNTELVDNTNDEAINNFK